MSLSKRGEIATTLTIISVTMMLAGLLAGRTLVQKPLKLPGLAQEARRVKLHTFQKTDRGSYYLYKGSLCFNDASPVSRSSTYRLYIDTKDGRTVAATAHYNAPQIAFPDCGDQAQPWRAWTFTMRVDKPLPTGAGCPAGFYFTTNNWLRDEPIDAAGFDTGLCTGPEATSTPTPTTTPTLTATPGPTQTPTPTPTPQYATIQGEIRLYSCSDVDSVHVSRCDRSGAPNDCSQITGNNQSQTPGDDRVWLTTRRTTNLTTYRYRLTTDGEGERLQVGASYYLQQAFARIGNIQQLSGEPDERLAVESEIETRDFAIRFPGWDSCQGPTPTFTPTPTATPTPQPTLVGSCTYFAKTYVKKCTDASDPDCRQTAPLTEFDGNPKYGTANNKQREQRGDRPDVNFSFQNGEIVYSSQDFRFDRSGGYSSGDPANVKLYYPGNVDRDSSWEIVRRECDEARSDDCPDPIRQNLTADTIGDFRLRCGMNVSYGWVLRKREIQSGQLEVRVVYSQTRPASCKRDRDDNLLFLDSAKISISGPVSRSEDMPKGAAHVNFYDLPAGKYKISVTGLDSQDVTPYETCVDHEWEVTAVGSGEARTRAVVVLGPRVLSGKKRCTVRADCSGTANSCQTDNLSCASRLAQGKYLCCGDVPSPDDKDSTDQDQTGASYNTFALNVGDADERRLDENRGQSAGTKWLCWSVGNNQGRDNTRDGQSFNNDEGRFACGGRVERTDGRVTRLITSYTNNKSTSARIMWQLSRCAENASNCQKSPGSPDGDRLEEAADLKSLGPGETLTCAWPVHLFKPHRGTIVSCQKGTTVPQSPTAAAPTEEPTDDDQPPPQITEPCHHLGGNGGLDVVFLPDGYSRLDEFVADARRAVDSLQETNLGNRINQMNFHAYTESLDKDFTWGVYSGQQNEDEIWASARKCNGGDVPVVMMKDAGVLANIGWGFLWEKGLGNYIVMGTSYIASPHLIFAHELGHIFDLDDEYVRDNARSRPPGFNCSLESSCSKWSGRYDCIRGCYQANRYRSSLASIMNSQISGKRTSDFNGASLEGWDRAASAYPRFGPVAELFDAHTTFRLTINQDKNKTLKVTDFALEESYPADYQLAIQDNYYEIRILDARDKQLFSGKVAQPTDRKIPLDIDESALENAPPSPDNKQIYLALPYSDEARKILIADEDGKQKLVIDLSDYALSQPEKTQNLCGNGICDARLGEDGKSCPRDCVPGESVVAKQLQIYAADCNDDGAINAIDYGRAISSYGKTGNDLACDPVNDQKIDSLDISIILQNLGVTL